MDLISFVELDLRLDLIPYDGLKHDFGADAAILADFSGLYIDGEIFDRIDVIRGSQLNRDQCEKHDVAFFFKQWGGRNKKAAGRELEGVHHDTFPKPKKRRQAKQTA